MERKKPLRKTPIIVIDGKRRKYSDYMGKASKYQLEFDQEVQDWLEKGHSFASFPARLYKKYGVKVSIETCFEWVHRYESFKAAKKVGEALGLEYYENLLRFHTIGIIPEELAKKGSKGIDIRTVLYVLSTRFKKVYSPNLPTDENENIALVNKDKYAEKTNEDLKKEALEMASTLKQIE
mgnify:CR=1 FL=1